MEKFNINSLPLIKLLLTSSFSLIFGLFISRDLLIYITIILILVGFALLLVNKHVFSYFAFSFALGFILSQNINQIQIVKPVSHFAELRVKIFGRIKNINVADSFVYKVRIEGEIFHKNFDSYKTSLLLTIFDTDGKLNEIEIGDKILCIGSIRPPRVSNLPTDPAETQIALSQEIEFFAISESKKVIRIWKEPGFLQSNIKKIRNFFANNLTQLFDKNFLPYYQAMLLGDKSLLELEQREKFATTGISHILALSGFHVAILTGIIFFALSFINNRWVIFLLVAALISLFLVIVNFPPSGVRASIMALAFLYLFTIERKSMPINVIALLIFIVLIFAPHFIFSVGFHLSFFAVLGIILFYNPFFQFFSNIFKTKNIFVSFMISLLATTISAQIFTAPLVAYYFGYYTFVSFFSNIILLPLFSLTILFGFTSLFFSIFSTEIGKIYGSAADFFLHLAITINNFIAKNFENLVIKSENVVMLAILVSILTIWLFATNKNKNFLFRLGFSTLILALFIINFIQTEDSKLQIFPRKKYVAIFIAGKDKNLCFLLDRKPLLYPSADFPMARFLSSKPEPLLLGVSGNAGIAVTDIVKNSKKVEIFEIPSEFQRKLSFALFGDLSLFKR